MKEIKAPYTQEVKCNNGTISYIRHVDVRFSPEAREEAESISRRDGKSRVGNIRHSMLSMKEYSSGIPNIQRHTNQRQKRKSAAQNR